MNAYLSIPLVGSAFVEIRNEWVGFGTEHHPRGDRELFLGHLQITFSPAQVEARRKALLAAVAAASILVVGIPLAGFGAHQERFTMGTAIEEHKSGLLIIPQSTIIPTLDNEGIG